MRVAEHSFCCSCVGKCEDMTEFVVRFVKKKKFKKNHLKTPGTPPDQDGDKTPLGNGTSLISPDAIKTEKGRSRRVTRVKVSYVESHDEEGIIGEPLLYQGQDFADSDNFLLQNGFAGSSDTYDPHLDDSGGGDGGEMAFEDFDFSERITVKVEPGQEEAMANLQSIKDEHPSVQIKLEPMELEEDCDFVYEDEEDLMLSSKKKKGRSKNSSNFASSLDPLTGKVKIKSTKKAAKKKNPSKDWYDNGITMTNPKNPSVYGCLSCEPHEDSSFKSTTCYVTLVEHLRKFHALLDLERTEEQEEEQAVEVKPKLIKDENGVVKVESNPDPSRGARILRCTICSETFMYPKDIRKHVSDHHTSEYRPYRCFTCNMGFKTNRSVRDHNAQMHGGRVVKKERNSLIRYCVICHQKFEGGAKALNAHYDQEHGEYTKEDIKSMKSRETRGLTQSRRKAERAVEDDPGVLMDNDINPMVFRCMDCCLNPTDKFHVFRRHISFYHTKPNSSLAEDTEVERKGTSTPTLQCTICLTEFKEAPALQNHVLEEHPTVFRPVRCPYCCLGFLTKASCNQHKSINHPEEMAAADSLGKKGKKGSITNDAAHFFRQQFGKDLQYDENTCKWLCIVPECQFTADSTARVKRHVRRVHLKLGNWKCEICEKEGRPTQKFTNLTNLNHHITGVHHGYSTKYRSKEELICDICGITKFGKTKMELHKIRVHTHLRPWVCTHCGKRFTTKHDLKRHEERAQGNCHLPKFQRTYSYLRCPFACNGRFSSQEELDQHLKMKEVNNGECPRIPKKKGMRGEFPCEHCGQVYTYRESLQKHLRMNHANRAGFTCDTCGKVYKHQIDMFRHARKAHGDESGMPFACTLCPKRYILQSNLKTHYAEKHQCTMEGAPLDVPEDDVASSSRISLQQHPLIAHLQH